jgi:hypothetical protein
MNVFPILAQLRSINLWAERILRFKKKSFENSRLFNVHNEINLAFFKMLSGLVPYFKLEYNAIIYIFVL